MPIEIYPPVQILISEIEVLSEVLTNLVYEFDLIRFTVNKNILSKYVSLIGYLKIEQLRLDLEVRKLKRVISLIQTCLNRNLALNLDEINESVDKELNQWAEELNQYIESVKLAELRVFSFENIEDKGELKKLYRELVKKLHPDINNNLSDEQKLLWLRVQECYINGNYQEMKTISMMMNIKNFETCKSDRIEDLEKIKFEINSNITKYLEQLEIIKNSYPYTLLKLLNNPDYIESEKSKICQIIDELKISQTHYEKILNEMKGVHYVVLNLN
jgi:hypothetical protein